MFISKPRGNSIPSETPQIHQSFAEFNITEILKQNIAKCGFTRPTLVQDQAIKPILEGRDVIGLASTGTGKTAAFLIPLIDKLYKNPYKKALIIAPTRELALQINEEFRNLSFGMRIFSAMVIGGTSMGRQISDIRRGSRIVVATPGRLKDLIERGIVNLLNYETIVLDEVDLMVDIGFISDVKFFISKMARIRQSLFFSATISPRIQSILQSFVVNPITVSLKKQATSENVEQDVVRVGNPANKIDQLHDLLIKDGFDKVLIFGRTKHGIEKLNKELNFRGFKVGTLHGNKRQSQRRRVLDSFKQNEIRILLATDVASRGLDIDNVTHVINYDLPETYEDYIHRIGRTGRIDKKGVALTFVG
ncbi:MAG: putative DEAD/DEAH box helicase domain protein [Microgenomates group bacterium Gr01-1014_7]|nr:MAG: putative DEAD/DEAH box helicase domain protein [Microgenomates group bacterium Gr01-1014_7]